MSELISTRIRDHAGKLGLTHLVETVDQLAARAETEQLGYLGFLDLLLEEELGLRESPSTAPATGSKTASPSSPEAIP